MDKEIVMTRCAQAIADLRSSAGFAFSANAACLLGWTSNRRLAEQPKVSQI